jgi:hypothetical protein
MPIISGFLLRQFVALWVTLWVYAVWATYRPALASGFELGKSARTG